MTRIYHFSVLAPLPMTVSRDHVILKWFFFTNVDVVDFICKDDNFIQVLQLNANRFLALILGPRGLGAPYMELGRVLGTIHTIVYRFLALILGPRGLGARYMELGRALGTILTDQVHLYHTLQLCVLSQVRSKRIFSLLMQGNMCLQLTHSVQICISRAEVMTDNCECRAGQQKKTISQANCSQFQFTFLPPPE